MGLIRKTYAQGYFTQRCRTGYHQVAGSLQAPSHHVGMWRLADSQFKFSREVRRASTSDRTKIPDVNGAVQIAVNVGSHAKDLPRRQTTPRESIGARTTLDLRLQDVRCGNQRRLGHLPVVLQLSPCSFKQLGQAVRNQVELFVRRKGRVWCGSLKSFHDQFLDELSDAPDHRENVVRGPPLAR